jgi:hypothetical protein
MEQRVFSRDLVAELNRRVARPRMRLRKGKEIDELWLARQLAPYGIRPRNIRIETAIGRGYMEEDLTDAFRRYIPPSELEDEFRKEEEGKAEGRSSFP